MSDLNQQNEETLDQLDETLDDLADMPSNAPWPAGAHLAKTTVKRNAKKPGSYIVEMTHQAVIELTNPNQDPEALPKEGDKSVVFITTKTKDGKVNEFGQGQLKLVLAPVGAMLGTNSISEILEAYKAGIETIVVVGIKPAKDNYEEGQTIKKLELAS